ncbi:ABC transporter permease [Bauldia sp.]|uniref:ABC transporter permease n=1 Tax=Bauldia sp. TaxID=2575872 RepID=UPI003BAA4BC0
MKTIRDLLRYSPAFRFGAIVLFGVLVLVVLSYFSPYDPGDRRVVPRNQAPSLDHIFGTTSQGQDVFWMLTFAIRNSIIVAGLAVIISRGIGVLIGMISGYLGGTWDRSLSALVDSFIVIPRLPLLILVAAILRGELTLVTLGILIGLLDWAIPSKRYRSQVLSLREREFTNTAVFSGMRSLQIVVKEHLPFLIPFLLADVVSGFLFAIGLEITLSVLGLGDMDAQSLGTMIYWGNYYQSLLADRVWVLAAPVIASVVIVVGFYATSIGLTNYLDPRTRLARIHVGDRA